MESDVCDSFLVGYQGRLISCASLADAVALKLAGQILDEPGQPDATLRELLQLVDVLAAYDLHEDSDRLRDIVRHTRAIQFLVSSRGYVRPKRQRPLAG